MLSLAPARRILPCILSLPLLAFLGCGGSDLDEDPLFNDQQAAVQRVDEELKLLRTQVEEMNRAVSNLLTEVENLKGEPLTGSVTGQRLDERVAVLETAIRESNQTLSEVRNDLGMRPASTTARAVTPVPSRSNDAPDVAPPDEREGEAVRTASSEPEPAPTRVTLQRTPAPPKPAATPKPKPAAGFYHIVRHGETVSTIAAQHGVSQDSIRRENRIPEGRQPIPGQQIYIVR